MRGVNQRQFPKTQYLAFRCALTSVTSTVLCLVLRFHGLLGSNATVSGVSRFLVFLLREMLSPDLVLFLIKLNIQTRPFTKLECNEGYNTAI